MQLQVAYTVPVEVVVDTDTGGVTRVMVVDEEVELRTDEEMDDKTIVHDRGYNRITDQAQITRAVAIARDADWPPWDHGF